MKQSKANGRPKAVIDYKLVEKLCGIQCTGEEIASVLSVDYDTLNARIKEDYNMSFSEYFKKHSGNGKASLRRNQFNLSKTNAAMCIWLGKQYLGQRDEIPENRDNVIKVDVNFVNKTDDIVEPQDDTD